LYPRRRNCAPSRPFGGNGARRHAGCVSAEPFGLLPETSPRVGAGAAPLPLAASAMMSGVRIGIDARKLHDFGIGTYIRNLLRQLARLDSQTEFVVLCRPEDRDLLAGVGENFRPVPETSGNYSIAEQFKI